MRRMLFPAVVLLLATVLCQAGTPSPLHVMLVNDDGIGAPGIEAMARVLAADPAYRVTVVAPDATTADALSTGLSVLGARKGIELVDRLPRVECMMMTRQADGTVRIHMSRGFAELVEKKG